MTTSEWEARWIKALTDGGTPYAEAIEAFKICYGNQDIDTRLDPVDEAKCFLPNRHLQRRNTDFSNRWGS